MLALPTTLLVVADAWRWRWFVHPDVEIAHQAADVLLSGHGLLVYSIVPTAQMGPLAIVLVSLPHAAYNIVVALLVLPFLMLAARPLVGPGVARSRRALWMVASTALVAPWAQLAWKGHADDALVLLGAAVVLTALAARRSGWVVAGWAVAVAGKPTALALAPLLLAAPRAAVLAGLVTTVIWMPFFLAAPLDLLRAGQGVMAVVPGDALSYLGVGHGRPPAWVRPVQLVLSWLGSLWGHLRERPAAGLLCGLAARAVLEPNPAPAYSIALVAVALVVDADRRLPVATALAAVGFWTSQMVLDGGSGLPRLAFLALLVAWCGWLLSGRALAVAGFWRSFARPQVLQVAGAGVATLAWAVTSALAAHPTTVLQRGSTGDGVRCVQWAVNHLTTAASPDALVTNVDGQYGPDTAGAVQQFQALYAQVGDFRQTVDGRVGPATGSVLADLGYGGAPQEWRCSTNVPRDATPGAVARAAATVVRGFSGAVPDAR